MPSAVSIVNGQVQLANASVNPGYPFFVPGTAGHRPPNPPLDTVDDGGLPRHVIVGGLSTSIQTRLDFSKTLVSADARAVSETGDPVELTAMAFHGLAACRRARCHTGPKKDRRFASYSNRSTKMASQSYGLKPSNLPPGRTRR